MHDLHCGYFCLFSTLQKAIYPFVFLYMCFFLPFFMFVFISLFLAFFLSVLPHPYHSFACFSLPTIQTLFRPTISTPASSPVVSKSTKITFAKEPEELENVAIIERRHRQRSQHTSNADVDDDKKDRLKDDVGQETTEDKEAEDDEGEGWVEASAERKHRGKGATFKKRWLRTKSLVS